MSILLYYNFIAETKSQIVSLTVLKNYRLGWHYLDVEGNYNDSFYQSNSITSSEYDELANELQIRFMEKSIPIWLLDNFLIQIQFS